MYKKKMKYKKKKTKKKITEKQKKNAFLRDMVIVEVALAANRDALAAFEV